MNAITSSGEQKARYLYTDTEAGVFHKEAAASSGRAEAKQTYTGTVVCAVRVEAVAGLGRAEARVFSDGVRTILNAKSMVRRQLCDREVAAGTDPVVLDVSVDVFMGSGKESESIFRLRQNFCECQTHGPAFFGITQSLTRRRGLGEGKQQAYHEKGMFLEVKR